MVHGAFQNLNEDIFFVFIVTQMMSENCWTFFVYAPKNTPAQNFTRTRRCYSVISVFEDLSFEYVFCLWLARFVKPIVESSFIVHICSLQVAVELQETPGIWFRSTFRNKMPEVTENQKSTWHLNVQNCKYQQ